jgi:cytoskeletal protein CcmA (bactofilin family)
MSDANPPKERPGPPAGAKPAVVALGTRLAATGAAHDAGAVQGPRSEIAEGLSFTGQALLAGTCTVRGRVEGNLKRAEGARSAVVVAESGYVKGDIVADQIAVMGRTEGLLDASGGSVALHESADVTGHVRYFRIQVNGSELNATLERAPAKDKRAP